MCLDSTLVQTVRFQLFTTGLQRPRASFHNTLWTSVITEPLLNFDAFDYSIITHIIIMPIYSLQIKKQFYSHDVMRY